MAIPAPCAERVSHSFANNFVTTGSHGRLCGAVYTWIHSNDLFGRNNIIQVWSVERRLLLLFYIVEELADDDGGIEAIRKRIFLEYLANTNSSFSIWVLSIPCPE